MRYDFDFKSPDFFFYLLNKIQSETLDVFYGICSQFHLINH